MMRRPLSACRMEFQLMFMQKLDSLLSPLGSHFCGSLTGIPASLLLQGVSIYTANKLNFSFMTPTTVSRRPSTEYAGATLPDNCVAIVKSLPGDRTLPGCPLAAWHWRLYMTGDKSASPKTLTPSASGVDVACGRKASRSLSLPVSLSPSRLLPPAELSLDVSCLIWRFVVVAMPGNPLGVLQCGVVQHSLFVSLKISSWA